MAKDILRVKGLGEKVKTFESVATKGIKLFDEVIIAKDGLEGSDIYKKEVEENRCFDLVLTDIKMPNKDGIEMIDDILVLSPNQRFIIVSAYKEEEHLLKLINLRVLGYFVKPLNIDNMMEMLQKAKDEVLADKEKEVDDVKPIVLSKVYSYRVDKKILYQSGVSVKLSKKEGQILEVLVDNLSSVVPVEKFKEVVWEGAPTNDSAFRTVMKRLKDKIIDDDFIVSHKGYGYIIEPPYK